jgi:Carboxypeptidase regulatory-like domain/Bacterial Ig-like domain (group 2)
MKGAYWLLQITTVLSICALQLDAHSISGNAGVESATMILTGTKNLTVTAGSAGNYFFFGLQAGNYIVTPSLSGYAFSPASQSVTIGSVGVSSVNFSATAVNGAPSPSHGATTLTDLIASPPVLTLTAAGATERPTVQASYSNGAVANVTNHAAYASNNTSVATVSQGGVITAVSSGNATVIASYDGFSTSVGVVVNIPQGTYTLSGSAGVASATVVISQGAASASTTASGSGAFSFAGVPSGSYLLTPSLAGYTFSPSTQSVTVTNANVSSVNFAATASPHSVDLTWGAGTIKDPSPGQVVVGYNVYRSSSPAGPYTQLNASPNPGLTFTDREVSAGETLYYVCSTVDSLGNVSGYSNQTTATIP